MVTFFLGLTPDLSTAADSYGTLRGLEHSLNPQLTRYAHETEFSISQMRKENRQKLFSVYQDMPVSLIQGVFLNIAPTIHLITPKLLMAH